MEFPANAVSWGNQTWDDGYPSGGNYWDDYTGVDTDGDGIGDTPYIIPLDYMTGSVGENEDRYPFMSYDGWKMPQLDIDAPTQVEENESFQVTITIYGTYDDSVEEASVIFDGNIVYTNLTGQVTLIAPLVEDNTNYLISASKDGYLSTEVWITVLNNDTPPPDLPPELDELPIISNITHNPHTVSYNDIVQIRGTVTDDNNLTSVKLYWDDGTEYSQNLIQTDKTDNNIYTGEIGPFVVGTNVSYWIQATDNASQMTQSSTFYFSVIDDIEPSITIENPMSNSTIYDVSPTISASFSDQSGIDLDSIDLTVDGSTVINSSEITATTITYTPLQNMTYGFHNVELELADSYGNIGDIQWSFTIAESEYIYETEIGNVSTGQPTEINTNHSGRSWVITINLTSTQNLSNVTFTVVDLEAPPDDITEMPPDNVSVFLYADLHLSENDIYIQEDYIESLTLTFKVPKTWIEDNNIDTESTQLLRFHDGNWQNLTTTFLSEDEIYIYFEVEAPGLSTFAIVGSKVVEVEVPYSSEIPEIPWTVIIGIFIAAAILLIVVIFKAGYIYTEEESDTEKDKKK